MEGGWGKYKKASFNSAVKVRAQFETFSSPPICSMLSGLQIRFIQICFTKYVTGFGVFVSRPYIDQYINSVRLFTALGLTMGNLILQATSIIFEAPRQGLHSSCNCDSLLKDGYFLKNLTLH